ncbi:ABC transporter substrate-binding protein/permease [Aquabacter spiritensis]|uniref:Amino acid ABC transporter substrate-binding protein (PAAT family) /amino acid ABC transporter membrane protein (PAAT family) n=1 Tax=Aquabacter spiritensis TaxID=933073 RepID=A0A4R3LRD6_9HYPH|nr:ABC transporter substrate-binding protein/permease [Aquabacter spiritensis]TCT01085.1 amino acid ABC transporter substrate-binding protein (PAAT family) /amino acid ABC transporter membrane protein (PAAT family) [Aquabacter spiritensis]
MRFALAVLLTLLSLGQALAQSPPPATSTPLRYGGDSTSGAPYTFKDPADPDITVGFEVDIMTQLGIEIGRKTVFVQNDWSNLIPGLNAGLYDAVINGLEITAAHQAAADFSIPYYVTFGQIVIRRGDADVPDIAALRGKSVGTLKSSQMEYVLRSFGGIDVRSYEEEIDAYSDLKLKRIDATVMDFPIAVYYAQPDRELQFTGAPVGRIEYGIAVKKGGNPQLLAQINTGLSQMIQDGEMRKILDRWGIWTPMMAQFTGDARPMQAQPDAYNHFVEATQPQGWQAQLERYMRFMPQLLWAAVMTMEISILAMFIAVGLGATLALCRVYGGVWLDRLAQVYIEVVRGTPLLIQVLFIYYGLPKIGIQLDPFIAGVLALGLNYAAYEAENYRAGLLAIPRHQMEAAIALNMTERQSLRHVVIPQAARIVLPPTTNDFISLIKDSSLVSVISLVELTKTYELISTTYYDYFGTGLLVAGMYLLLGLPFVRLAKWAERHVSRGMTRTTK